MRSYDDLVRHEGNALLFAAVEISIVSSLAGRPMHVHAEGVRGTGKTTIFRAAADILPTIERIAACEQNCRMWAPHCPVHCNISLSDIGGELAWERIPMPFREISHSAKLGTVVGSIDLAQVMGRDKPQAALLLGTIPRSNRGIIFVDEVNRLADTSPELTDVLLDVMGTRPGRIQIEEAGLPVMSMPVEISVWAASNPDEDPGPLEDVRRQLSDRFDLSVEMGRTSQAAMIRRILEYDDFVNHRVFGGRKSEDGGLPARSGDNSEQFRVWGSAEPQVVGVGSGLSGQAEDAEGQARVGGRMAAAGSWPGRLSAAALLAPQVEFSDGLIELLATIYVDFDIESIRAMESARSAARCRAALAGRSCVSIEDLRMVLPLALRHRVDVRTLANILRYVDALQEKAGHGHGRLGAPVSYGGLARSGVETSETSGTTGMMRPFDTERQRRGESAGSGSRESRDGVEHGRSSNNTQTTPGPKELECGGPGLRGILHRLLERMKSEEHLNRESTEAVEGNRCCPGKSGDGVPRGSVESTGGRDRGFAGGVPSQNESCPVSEVCPPKPARPITNIGPKIVFAEDDLG